jgi:hypothetical protein
MSTEPFTDEEKTEILRFLDYPDWQSMASSVGLGYPSATQPMYQTVDAFVRITPTGRAMVRRDLEELRCIERQRSEARQRFAVLGVEDVKLNQNETRQLGGETAVWKAKLANDLGTIPNPYALASGGGGGINARVR